MNDAISDVHTMPAYDVSNGEQIRGNSPGSTRGLTGGEARRRLASEGPNSVADGAIVGQAGHACAGRSAPLYHR
jgi:hypothetical protein